METENIQKTFPRTNLEIDFLKVALIFISRWYVLLGMVLLAITIAHFYLRYCPKTYQSSGLLKFEEKKPELSELIKVMNNTARSPASLQSEKSIIQSRTILLKAIRQLNYNISFYTKNNFGYRELYPHQPLQINLLKTDKPAIAEGLIAFNAINNKTFRLSWQEEGKKIKRIFTYNRPITIYNTRFTIHHKTALSKDTTYLFRFQQPESLLERVSKGLEINEALKNASAIRISQTDTNPYFSADVLNAIMTAYLHYDQSQKAQSATQMISFISGQLGLLSSTVKNAENALEQQKQNSGIIDIRLSANQTLSKLSELEAQRSLLNVQETNIRQLKNQVSKDKEISMNFNLEGDIDPLLATLIGHLNNLLRDKQTLLKTYQKHSIPVREINDQLVSVRSAALQNINASQQRLRENQLLLNTRISQLNKQATTLPAAEKDLLSLGRNFSISEKVHSFLAEKKLETQINRAAILPGATIVEQAPVNLIPLTPDKPKTYRMAAVLGLLSGLGALLLFRTYTPYVYNQETVQSATNIPIAVLIPKFQEHISTTPIPFPDLVKQKTAFAESIRALRIYVNFLATEKNSKIICITSEISGEGKSFVAVQLATALAMINKKVILIGADLRRPNLHTTFGTSKDPGLSNYLQGQRTIPEIIRTSTCKNLDFINSGPASENPAELLYSEKMATLLSKLREKYELILLDTPPVGMVSDAIPLCCLSDINLFIIRYGKSRRKALNVPQGLADKYHLNHMTIVLNAFEENRFQASYYKDEIRPVTTQYYTDYSHHQNSGYYENQPRLKWWNIHR